MQNTSVPRFTQNVKNPLICDVQTNTIPNPRVVKRLPLLPLSIPKMFRSKNIHGDVHVGIKYSGYHLLKVLSSPYNYLPAQFSPTYTKPCLVLPRSTRSAIVSRCCRLFTNNQRPSVSTAAAVIYALLCTSFFHLS